MFIILPVGMNYRTERLPIVSFTLMGVNVLTYLICLPFTLAQEGHGAEWIFEHLWLTPASAAWYSYLTAMFVHGGFLHLLGNMVYLFLFGCCVEDIIGRWRFLTLYLAAGVFANLAYVGLTPEHFASDVPMGGASGAVSACMGAYVLLRAKAEIEFKYFILFFFRLFSGEFSLAAWIVISFWFLKDLFFAGISYYAHQGGGGVAFGAHVGGFVAGAGFAGIDKLLKARPKKAVPAPARVQAPRRIGGDDPSEAPNAAQTIHIYQSETQYGPYNLYEVRDMVAQGSITAQAQYWIEGMPEWRNIGELIEFQEVR
jgi:membrane associated rhomboid family serine protease